MKFVRKPPAIDRKNLDKVKITGCVHVLHINVEKGVIDRVSILSSLY